MICSQSAKRAALNEWDNVVSTARTCRKLWRNLIFETPTFVTAFRLACHCAISQSSMPSLASRLRQSLSFLRTRFLGLRPHIYTKEYVGSRWRTVWTVTLSPRLQDALCALASFSPSLVLNNSAIGAQESTLSPASLLWQSIADDMAFWARIYKQVWLTILVRCWLLLTNGLSR